MASLFATDSNIMLAIQEKKTSSVDLYLPLRKYIRITYSEREAQNLEDNLATLNQLRSHLETMLDSSPTERRDLLISYFKALCVVEGRFPISSDASHVNITFIWQDAFKSKLSSSQTSIHLEKASVLFNLGAVFSKIGMVYDRSTLDGRRDATHAFMSAAGVFAYLRDNESANVSMGSSTIVDLSAECSWMLERLMLAQGQECYYESAVAKRSTPGVCAQICRQVGLYYEEALAALGVAPLNDHFQKGWISHVQLKAALFHAEACYWYSLELHVKEEIAEEIVRLRSGISVLTDAKKSSKQAPAQLLEASIRLEADLKRNLERGVRENEKVYCMRIPSSTSLSPLPAKSMVQPKLMNELLDASEEKMFASLVPNNNAKAISKYTKKVDGVMRKQAEKLQQASELTRVGLSHMGLPDSILAIEHNLKLPDNLKEDVKGFQTSGGLSGLISEIKQLKDLISTKREWVFQKEAVLEAQFILQNPRSSTMTKNTKSGTLIDNVLAKLKRFESNLQQADKIFDQIESFLEQIHGSLLILGRCNIESAFPLPKSMMSMKQSLRELEILGAQAADLENMLKETKRKDDILPKLMMSAGSYRKLFREEISKYDRVCEEIAQNIVAQENLLSLIQGQHKELYCGGNPKLYEAVLKAYYNNIQTAVYKYREIKKNINDATKLAESYNAS